MTRRYHLGVSVDLFYCDSDRLIEQIDLMPDLIKQLIMADAFANISDAVLLFDANHTLLDLNKSAEEAFGINQEDWVGRSIEPLYANPLACHRSKMILEGTQGFKTPENGSGQQTFMHDYRRHDGMIFPGRTSYVIRCDEDNQLLGYVQIICDTTDRQVTDQIIQQNHERLLALAEHTPAAVAMVDTKMTYIASSRSWRRLFALDGENVLGANWYDIQPGVPEYWRMAHRRCLAGHVQRQEEDYVQWVDAEPMWLTWEVRPWYSVSGEMGGLVMYAEDVTQRKHAAQQLARQASLLSNIVDTIPYHVFWKDQNSVFLGCNTRLAQSAGLEHPDQIVGKTDLDMPWAKHAAHYQKDDRSVVSSGQAKLHIEEEIVTEDGDEMVISTSKLPLRDKYGDVSGVVGIFEDVTEKRQIQRDLEAAKELAENANRSKSEFLANMSHEIRTPMTAILGFTEILLNADLKQSEHTKHEDDDSEQVQRQDALQTIQRNGEHLLSLINDILDLSKVEAGKMQMHQAPVCIDRLAQDAFELMKVRADAKQIGFKLKWLNEPPKLISTDETRIRQILVNLLGNAIKFTDRGSVELICESKIEHTILGQRCIMQMQVLDTGIGISNQQLQDLFKPFEMGDSSASRKYGGTGLGLAISRRLAQALGGDITVSSVINEGSTFTFCFESEVVTQSQVVSKTVDDHVLSEGKSSALPGLEQKSTDALQTAECDALSGASDSSELSESASRHEAEKLIVKQDLSNVHVLLAEDGLDNQRLISHLIKRFGATVKVVENGYQAIETLKQHAMIPSCDQFGSDEDTKRFDLILMDMQMPVLDGYQAATQLRQLGCDLPIVALTAHAMSGDKERCLEAGCTDYLSKPVAPKDLLRICAQLVAQARLKANREDDHLGHKKAS